MVLDIETIKSVTRGTENIVQKETGVAFLRFTDEEAKCTDNDNVFNTAGIVMEFDTDAKALSFTATVRSDTGIRSYFAFDIFENGEKIASPCNFNEAEMNGDYAHKEYPLGRFSFEIPLSAGDKRVKIVFPHSVVAELEDMQLKAASFVKPVRMEKKLIAYGDSITQGYDARYPSNTYAMRLAEHLQAELISKALGGDMFASELVEAGKIQDADYVLVAYGTNDWYWHSRDKLKADAQACISAVAERFSTVPVFVLSPIWRNGWQGESEFGDFTGVGKLLEEICRAYPNITFIQGFDLVPHECELFGDLGLHPSDEGFAHYFKNLKNAAKL